MSPGMMKSGWQSGLLQPKPPPPRAWSPATCPREAPRWRGARRCLGRSHPWGTEPRSRAGAPDHFSNSQFQFSFESGCVRVRPILIPGYDSKPGFRFLLPHCTVGGGRARGAALFPTKCFNTVSLCTQPFLWEGWAWLPASSPRGIATRAGKRLQGRPCHPGHPGAATGAHVSTPKQEVSDKSGFLGGTQGPSPPFERDLGATHRSLLSQHLRGWGQPGCRRPGALPRPP